MQKESDHRQFLKQFSFLTNAGVHNIIEHMICNYSGCVFAALIISLIIVYYFVPDLPHPA